MSAQRTPTYPLTDIKTAVRDGRYLIRGAAVKGAADLYLDEEDVKDWFERQDFKLD